MRSLQVAPRARSDLAAIFEDSEVQFGKRAADRYRRLVAAALRDLRIDPRRFGVIVRPELPAGTCLYHLRHSRLRVASEGRVGQPRHLLVFRSAGEDLIVVRVLHDAMDLARHL